MNFKFEIGDFVKFKDNDHHGNLVHQKFRVILRLFDECPGGVQMKYRLRDYTRLQAPLVQEVQEFELERWTPEDELTRYGKMWEQQFENTSLDYLLKVIQVAEKELDKRYGKDNTKKEAEKET